jgi:hypothetical protein
MSVSFGCNFNRSSKPPTMATCPERAKPAGDRAWEVWARFCNHSAFNGYHETSSDWSSIYCKTCGALGRTKAGYVHVLPDRDRSAE